MTKNVGNTDKVVRAAIGVIALVAAFLIGITSGWGIVLAVVAVIALVTAAVGFCPLYRVFGINTCATK
ncbi:MAG: DUF2892 domain-containing protein [Actinobacteria bacterium HGW-Actinobacteria-2]|nr:MAG: DUF2892 domain-containing protein [Actinobacteria bacterium HGW-Actinobacteria-2]